GRRAVAIDRSGHSVALDDGSAVAYDALLLATGARPRPIDVPGANLAGVHFLRNLADVDGIRASIRPGGRAVIVGGGYIGLEVAASLRELGLEVTVLEMADRVMSRVTSVPVSTFYEAEHERRGVRIVRQARVQAFSGAGGRVEAAACADGSVHPADLVIVGVGVTRVAGLARAAGLACDNGIVVDEYCRTSDPDIYAAGDCTNHPSLHYGMRVRLESVDNAFEQGASAALNMLGTPARHDKVPWFWSDQYDLKLVIVGLAQGHDQVALRGDPASRSFSVCYLRDGELLAIDTINNAKDQLAARKLIASRARPVVERLTDPAIPLKECVSVT